LTQSGSKRQLFSYPKLSTKMNWSYVLSLLKLYGFPTRLIQWLQWCIMSSRFYVLLNGHADGFITPTRGLRQRCVLSPYLFILAMNLFSIMLRVIVQNRQIEGVKLACRPPTLTNIMYADDLLILDEATEREVEVLIC
jgi:Reverse transcriptase (RNA-dependent DNA polymerase)